MATKINLINTLQKNTCKSPFFLPVELYINC